VLARRAAAGGAPLGLELAQLDAADLAGDGLRQVGDELDPAHPLVGRELAGAIFAFARERLSPYKRIRRLEFTDLPKTISGKIRRVELRTAEAEQVGTRPEGEYREEDFAG